MTSHPTKKLINNVDCCVDEALEGMVAVTPGIVRVKGHRVIVREDIDDVKKSGKVTLLSGGGSGHEPSHAGFVGKGMLSGAVAGSVFASPPTSSILAAIETVGRGNAAGTLLIVKNYTGDCLNFGIAMERAKADGLVVDMVVVGDDCALAGQDLTDRRGLAGTVFVHKLAGAMAENGESLHHIKEVVEAACKSMGTIGICLYPCSVPGAGPSFSLGPQDIGLGLGIHGEAGVKTLKLSGADDTVKTMLDHMRASTNNCRLNVQSGDEVALMVNNLGGTSYIELCIVARAAIKYLETTGVKTKRVYCGAFMTSLEMAGISLTLLHLDKSGIIVKCLDQPTTASAWPHATKRDELIPGDKIRTPLQSASDASAISDNVEDADAEEFLRLKSTVVAVCDKLIASEQLLNELDTGSGDGDCGSTLKQGALEMKAWVEAQQVALPASHMANHMSSVAEQAMGGSSGAFYGLFLLSSHQALPRKLEFLNWVDALKQGMDKIKKYGKADVGDRTMLDSMDAAHKVLQKGVDQKQAPLECLVDAVNAAEKAASDTARMAAKAGRARYVNPDQLGRPDPGATAFAIWLRAAMEKLQELHSK